MPPPHLLAMVAVLPSAACGLITGRRLAMSGSRDLMRASRKGGDMSGNLDTGRCFCGAIVAELSGEPFWVTYDHDDDCRRAIGSPLAVWIGYRPAQFRLIRGTPRHFSRTPGVTRTFCANCGTSIGYLDAGLPDELYLSIGFMDRPERFAPQAHGYWSLKLPWVELSDRLPRIDRYTRPRDPSRGDPDVR